MLGCLSLNPTSANADTSCLSRSLLLATFKRLPGCEAAEPAPMPLLLTRPLPRATLSHPCPLWGASPCSLSCPLPPGDKVPEEELSPLGRWAGRSVARPSSGRRAAV